MSRVLGLGRGKDRPIPLSIWHVVDTRRFVRRGVGGRSGYIERCGPNRNVDDIFGANPADSDGIGCA